MAPRDICALMPCEYVIPHGKKHFVDVVWLIIIKDCSDYQLDCLARQLSGKESACQCRRCRTPSFNPWFGKTHWRSKWQPTPAFLPGKSQGQRSLMGYNPWGLQPMILQRVRHDWTHILKTPQGRQLMPNLTLAKWNPFYIFVLKVAW